VIVARKLPGADPVHKSVDVPDPPFTLVGLMLHNRSVELVVWERRTVPLKPLSGAIVITDDPLVPVVTEIVVGFVAIEKSCT